MCILRFLIIYYDVYSEATEDWSVPESDLEQEPGEILNLP